MHEKEMHAEELMLIKVIFYINFFILFNRSEPKKTKVKKRTLNPKFEESFLFEVKKKEMKLPFNHRVKQVVSVETVVLSQWGNSKPNLSHQQSG